jgi:rfaE bifunctional protein kinase chain/domain
MQWDADSATVLVVGDAMLDQYWFGDVERVSPEAPVPVVHVKREEFRLGGAANVALNVATLGGSATLLSVVGRDAPAKRMEELLNRAMIAYDLHVDDDVQTTVKLRVSGRSQQLLRIDFENAPSGDTLDTLTDAMERHVAEHRVVVFSDYGKGSLAQIERKIDIARRLDRPVLIDPKGRDWEIYRGASVVTPNRAELAQVVGAWRDEIELHDKAQALRDGLSLQALLVTRSEEGMTLFDASGVLHVPTVAREVFDVTGAGDTVLATLAAMLAGGLDLREAVPVANRAGGIVVGKFGTSTLQYSEL